MTAGLYLRTGPFTVHVETPLADLRDEIACLYAGHPIADRAPFADFHVEVSPTAWMRRWYRPQVRFAIDGIEPFRPLPREQSLPMFEWGLNWCLANRANQYLIIHAATIEKDGRAVIMPGVPGAGKSTLAAGLVHRGWRLLSDELTLISLGDGLVHGLARPISLKNESIAVMRDFAPGATFSRLIHGTVKGTVALLRPPADSIARVDEPARPRWIVFPKYLGGLPAVLERRRRAASFMTLAKNAFNYSELAERSFAVLAAIVGACGCFKFTYASLDEAVGIFDRLDTFRADFD